MKPAMRDLVHAGSPRPFRVTLPHRDQYQDRLSVLDVGGEDRASLSGRLRDVELYAAVETRSVAAFGFAAP